MFRNKIYHFFLNTVFIKRYINSDVYLLQKKITLSGTTNRGKLKIMSLKNITEANLKVLP